MITVIIVIVIIINVLLLFYILADTNLQLYDLHIGKVGEAKGSEDGCQREDWSCRKREGSSSKESTGHTNCGIKGQCVGTFLDTHQCICNPGWTGNQCSVGKHDFQLLSFNIVYFIKCKRWILLFFVPFLVTILTFLLSLWTLWIFLDLCPNMI